MDDCTVSVNGVVFSKSLNRGKNQVTRINAQAIEMWSGPETDFFNAPNGREKYANAPLLLIPMANTQPFTFVTKATPAFAETYDAGAVYVFVNNDVWQKFAFERDEQQRTRLVTVRTNVTSDDNNHDAVTEKTVYLKISSNVESIGYYYSVDNTHWQLVRVYKNDFPDTFWLGISAQSPLGKGMKTVFEDCILENKAIQDFRKGI